MTSGGEDHVLIWMRDRERAERLAMAFERCGLGPIWAASLPEAVGDLDSHFPRAVACTLEKDSPSLMDLETLLAYLTIGHDSVSLPPVPIWALTSRIAHYAGRIRKLDLPIRLVPVESGIEGLAAEVVHHLRRLGRGQEALNGNPPLVLYLGPDPRVGFYLSRYLESRDIPTLTLEIPREALTVVKTRRLRVLVADLPGERDGVAFLREVAEQSPEMPVVVLGKAEGWLTRLSPRDLPRNLACMLLKPLKAETLEACLRRLLRIREPRVWRPSGLLDAGRYGAQLSQ